MSSLCRAVVAVCLAGFERIRPWPLLACLAAGWLASAAPASACNSNGVCEASAGETCTSCPADCDPRPTFDVSDYHPAVGQAVVFTPFGVADPQPAWDLGNAVHLTGNPLTYAYAQPGVYQVVLTGTDAFCNTTQTSLPQAIVVSNAACDDDGTCEASAGENCTSCPSDCDPRPTFNVSDYHPAVGQPIELTGFGVADPQPAWDLGNAVHLTGNPLTYTYTQPGVYNVVFTGTDAFCNTTQDSFPQGIVVSDSICDHDGTCDAAAGETCTTCAADCDPPPTFTLSQHQAAVGQPVQFTGFGVADPLPAWDFGNGVHDNGNPLSYAYPQAGVYNVVFTGTDAQCNTTQDSLPQSILITAATCNQNGTCDPSESCSSCPGDCGTCGSQCAGVVDGFCDGAAGETCTSCPADCDPKPTFSASSLHAGVGEPIQFTGFGVADALPAWDFGNGFHDYGSPKTYSYPQPGNYAVKFTGTDAACNTTQDSDPQIVHITTAPICTLAHCEDGAAIEVVTFPPSACQGTPASASVTVRNIGTSTWTRAAGYKLGSVSETSAFSTSNRIELPAGVEIPPGGLHTFVIPIDRVPPAGTWQSQWRMVREYVVWFGGVASSTIVVPNGCGGSGPGGSGNFHCRGVVKDFYGTELPGRRVVLSAESWDATEHQYILEDQQETTSRPDGTWFVSSAQLDPSIVVKRLTCEVFPKRYSESPRRKRITLPYPAPLSTTLELEITEVPAPRHVSSVVGERDPLARVGLYRNGAYDKVVVLAEPMNPVEQVEGRRTLDELWFLFRNTLVPLERAGVDVWLVNTYQTGQNLHEQASEFAQALDYATQGYPASLPGGAPNFPGKVVTLGVSLGGITSRIATARWESNAPEDQAWRQGLGLSSPTPPVLLSVYLDAPLQGAQVNRELQDLLWDAIPLPFVWYSSAKEFDLNSCSFQQLIIDSTVGEHGDCTGGPNSGCNRKAFFNDGRSVRFPHNGICDSHAGGKCICRPGPAVQFINGDGFAHSFPKVAYSDGAWGVRNQCYGDSKDITAGGDDVCPHSDSPWVPQVGDELYKLRIPNFPDVNMHAGPLDLLAGSRQAAVLAGRKFNVAGINLVMDQFFGGTFMPIASALATATPGCGPFDDCRTAGFAGTHVNPVGAEAQWIMDKICGALGASCPLAPLAQMEAPPAATEPGQVVAFDGSASVDPDGQVTQYTWDFGDGTVKTGPTPSHQYAAAGSYPVRLSVTDDSGYVGFTDTTLRVGPPNLAPVAAVEVAPQVRVGEQVAFDASASADPDGRIDRFIWSFGDGTVAEGPNASHVFDQAGDHAYSLTVVDDSGESLRYVREVSVSEPTWQDAPVPSAPLGCTPSPRPEFSWSALDWATRYALEVRGALGTTLVDVRELDDTSYLATSDLPAGQTLRWRVRGCNATGCGAWSQEQAFKTGCSGLPAPAPLAPLGCLQTAQPTLSWSAVAQASAYELRLERAFDGQLVQHPTVSATSYLVPAPLSAWTEYRFLVRALGGATPGAWSTPRYFTTHCLPELIGTAAQLVPEQGATVGVLPTFEWEPASNATEYSIEVVSPGLGAFSSPWYPAATHCTGARCATTLSAPLIGGPSTWRIRGRNASATGPWGQSLPFTVTGTLQSPWRITAVADFDGDTKRDLVWQHAQSGDLRVWLMNGAVRKAVVSPTPSGPGGSEWELAGAADLNADRKSDLLFEHRSTSELRVWYMDGLTRLATDTTYPDRPASDVQSWNVQALGDYDADGKADILWQHQTQGYLVAWLMNGVERKAAVVPTPNQPASDVANWKVAVTEKLVPGARDGGQQWLWQQQLEGWLVDWDMKGVTRTGTRAVVPNRPEGDAANWKLVGSADFDADGKLDLLFRNDTTGANLIWRMNGTTRLGTLSLDFY